MTIEFAQRLDANMKLRGYSQRMLGAEAGVDHSTLSRLLKGDREATTEIASKLSSCLIPRAGRVEFVLLAHGHSVAEVEKLLHHHVKSPDEIRSTRRK